VQFAKRVRYDFDFSGTEYWNDRGSIKIEEFDTIKHHHASEFRWQLRLLILYLLDLQYKYKGEEIVVPDCVKRHNGVVVTRTEGEGERKRLLYGKIVTFRENCLVSKHVAKISNGQKRENVLLSDMEMIHCRSLYDKYKKFKPDQMLSPKWCWKERDNGGDHHYFVCNQILTASIVGDEKVLCQVKLDTGESKKIVVDVEEEVPTKDCSKLTVDDLEKGFTRLKDYLFCQVAKWVPETNRQENEKI